MLISASKAVKINSHEQEKALQWPAVEHIACEMAGAAARAANFLEAVSLVQLHGLVHCIERFQVAGFVSLITRSFQTCRQHFLSETFAPAFA